MIKFCAAQTVTMLAKTDDATRNAAVIGLSISEKKAKVMEIHQQDGNIKLEELEKVTNFTYLGSNIIQDGNLDNKYKYE